MRRDSSASRPAQFLRGERIFRAMESSSDSGERSAPKQIVEADRIEGRKISHIQFGMFSPDEVAKLAEFEAVSSDFRDSKNMAPAKSGVLDRRLGVSDKSSKCETCGMGLQDCPGHFGRIKLELPVFHVGYFKPLVAVLQCICKTCSRVLLPLDKRPRFLKQMNHPMTQNDHVRRAAVFRKVLEACKKEKVCPHCAAINGVVKKVGCMRIIHERLRERAAATKQRAGSEHYEKARSEFRESFEEALRQPKGGFEVPALGGAELAELIKKAHDDLHPLRVRALLRAIPEAELAFLDMSACYGRPENLLIDELLVPPVPIRPSVITDSAIGSNEDDLTVKLTDIITTNNIIRNAIGGGKALVHNVMEDWEFLQLQCALYINGPNVPSVRAEWHAQKRSIRAFAQRLKGKTGRFRGNLSGKRVDFSGRTVISPDPNLGIDEVCVPQQLAKILTYPQRVSAHNISKLRELVANGTDEWPGANYVEKHGKGGIVGKKALMYSDRHRVAAELQVGDVVERHLCDGDVVLFNRQPSLHKMSIMAHRARVMGERTFRFNECVCAPYNADFDGDEMNLHLPQTEEARAESLLLLGVHQNLVTPRNGEVVVAATQDFLTGAYLLSRKNVFLTRDQFCRLCAYLSDANEHIELPPPAILKPVEMWTGKQVFEILLRPSSSCPICLNLATKNKSYNNKRESPEPFEWCADDGFVVFRNSTHVCGVLDKAILGGGSKNSLFAVLLRDHSKAAAAACMGRLAKLTSRLLADVGFSIGIEDVMPTAKLTAGKSRIMENGYQKCRERIDAFENGTLPPSPGCTTEQTLESEINGLLSKIRDDAGEICKRELHPLNAPLAMATCGAKGSFINISQARASDGYWDDPLLLLCRPRSRAERVNGATWPRDGC